MQIARIVQAVTLMLIVALAASCAATKEYTSKIFPTKLEAKDSQAVALRFLDLDKLEPDQENWVSTDIIMGRDTGNKTAALDKLSEVFPSQGISGPKKETAPAAEKEMTKPVYVNSTPATTDKVQSVKTTTKNPGVNSNNPASVNKTTAATTTPVIVAEKKTEPDAELPVARTYTNGEVREKKTREEQ